MYYTQDTDNVRRNLITVVSQSPVYNAISKVISKEKQIDAVDPVTVADVKTFSHIDETDDDAKIALLIPACCDMIENYSGIGLRRLDVKARILNASGNIDLLFQQYGDVKDADGNVIDTTIPNGEEQIVVYTAGTDAPGESLKSLVLMQIDFVLRGGVGLDPAVKSALQNYM